MENLLNHTGNHVSLGVLDGTDVLYLERLAADDSTVNITRVAGRLPVHGCSAGLVFMAFAPDEDRELFLQRRLTKLTEDTVTTSEELRVIMADARRLGYVSMAGIIVEESSGISVPIFIDGGRVAATLTLIVPRGDERLSITVPQLKLAARAISRRLGHRPPPMGMQRRSAP